MNVEVWVDVVASDFNLLMAASSSSTVKSDDMLASAVAALESEVTSRDVQRPKSLSASGKRPLFSSCEAIACAVTGHLECVALLPVSLFMVFHALRLECVKSTYSTTSVHLALRTSSILWSIVQRLRITFSTDCAFCDKSTKIGTLVVFYI